MTEESLVASAGNNNSAKESAFKTQYLSELNNANKHIDAMFKADQLPPSALLKTLERYPLISQMALRLNDSASTIFSTLRVYGNVMALPQLSLGFNIAELTLNALNLVSTLITYFVYKKQAQDNNQVAAFTLTNVTNMAILAIFIALAIVSLALPFVALKIALAAAVFGLATSLGRLIVACFTHQKNKSKVLMLEEKINRYKPEIEEIKNKLTNFKSNTFDEEDLENVKAINIQLASKKQALRKEVNEHEALKKEIVEFNPTAILIRLLGVVLGTGAITGLALMLTMPPIGVAILLGVSITGLIVTTVSITAPYLIALKRKLVGKEGIAAEDIMKNNNAPTVSSSDILIKDALSSSTKSSPMPKLADTPYHNSIFVPLANKENNQVQIKPDNRISTVATKQYGY